MTPQLPRTHRCGRSRRQPAAQAVPRQSVASPGRRPAAAPRSPSPGRLALQAGRPGCLLLLHQGVELAQDLPIQVVLTAPGQGAAHILAQDLAAQKVGSAVSLHRAASSRPAAQLWAAAPALGHILRPHGGDTALPRPAAATRPLIGQSWNAPGRPASGLLSLGPCLGAAVALATNSWEMRTALSCPPVPQAGEWPGALLCGRGQCGSRHHALRAAAVMGLRAGAGGGAGEAGAAVSFQAPGTGSGSWDKGERPEPGDPSQGSRAGSGSGPLGGWGEVLRAVVLLSAGNSRA